MEQLLTMTTDKCTAASFEELLIPHQPYLYRLAYRLTGSEADSYDLMQDVLIKLYLQRHKLYEIEHLRSWLTTVLYRTFIDGQRRLKNSPLRLLIGGKDMNDKEVNIDDFAGSHPTPAQQLEEGSLQQTIQAAIGKLSKDQRLVCVLHDMEGYTLPELTEILATPIGTLKSRLHRARARLKKILPAH